MQGRFTNGASAFAFTLSLCHFVALSLLAPVPGLSEPVVLMGRDLPAFIGAPVGNLRIVNARGAAIPFQIDEKTAGEIISPTAAWSRMPTPRRPAEPG